MAHPSFSLVPTHTALTLNLIHDLGNPLSGTVRRLTHCVGRQR